VSSRQQGAKRDSVAVTIMCALSMAVAVLAIVGSYIPYLAGVAVFISAPAVLGACAATGVAQLRRTRLVLPALALLLSAVPAARYNWKQSRIVWVESAELCHPPSMGVSSLVALLGNLALSMDYEKAVGNNICGQLGRDFSDSNCDGELGRIKCE
jgi:hypothetical protein